MYSLDDNCGRGLSPLQKTTQVEPTAVEDEESGDEESVEGAVADIISALPDPDCIYGAKEEDIDEEGDVYRGPAVEK